MLGINNKNSIYAISVWCVVFDSPWFLTKGFFALKCLAMHQIMDGIHAVTD